MARIGIAITMSCAFRDSTQEFSNVFYYSNGAGGLPSVAQAEELIDELTALWKARHSSAVTFVRGRVWSQVGSAAQNNMIAQKQLSGTGGLTPQANVDRERAYLFRRRAGIDSRGNPVYLRKWLHTCGPGPGNVGLNDSTLANQTGFSQASRDTMTASIAAINGLATGGGSWSICAKSGREPTEPNWVAHKYFEHHQFGDQWRG